MKTLEKKKKPLISKQGLTTKNTFDFMCFRNEIRFHGIFLDTVCSSETPKKETEEMLRKYMSIKHILQANLLYTN